MVTNNNNNIGFGLFGALCLNRFLILKHFHHFAVFKDTFKCVTGGGGSELLTKIIKWMPGVGRKGRGAHSLQMESVCAKAPEQRSPCASPLLRVKSLQEIKD